jgi:protoheme IX farnesyltransferase
MIGPSGDTTLDSTLRAQQAASAAADKPVRLPHGGRLLDYAILLKPRVMSLVLFTAMVGLLLAPGSIPLGTATIAVICIAIGAGASGAINMWYDRDIDSMMERTVNRPLPAGRMHPRNALVFGTVLSVLSVAAMWEFVNFTAAWLLAVTIGFYVFIYTVWLKRRTPQNIVIGGASGAFPPMIGWAAVTGMVSWESVVLFAIIFLWTPPHFWALALYRSGDYERAGVPMMPVVAGTQRTKREILAYSLILVPFTVAPAFLGMATIPAGALLAILALWFVRHAIVVFNSDGFDAPRAMFRYSILHLFLIFVVLLGDHYIAPFFY